MKTDIEVFYQIVVEAVGEPMPETVEETVLFFEDAIFIANQIKKRLNNARLNR